MHTRTLTCTHTHARTHTHICTHTHTHTYTHTHTHKHTHTYTHYNRDDFHITTVQQFGILTRLEESADRVSSRINSQFLLTQWVHPISYTNHQRAYTFTGYVTHYHTSVTAGRSSLCTRKRLDDVPIAATAWPMYPIMHLCPATRVLTWSLQTYISLRLHMISCVITELQIALHVAYDTVTYQIVYMLTSICSV